MTRNRLCSIVAVFVSICTLGLTCARAQEMEDVVHLKDGRIVRGTILEQTAGQSLRIQIRDGNVLVIWMKDIDRIAKEPVLLRPAQSTAVRETTGRRKEPYLAGTLSVLLAGSGQVYNGQYAKGALFAATYLGGAIVMFTSYDWSHRWNDEHDFGGRGAAALLGGLVAIGSMAWSAVDAFHTSDRMNLENGWGSLQPSPDGPVLIVRAMPDGGAIVPVVGLMLRF